MIDYLANIKSKNVIPSYASIDESALYVIEASERDFNSMMRNIGLNELGILEATGKPIVYEAGKISTVIDAAIEFLKKLWSGIEGMFNKFLHAMKAGCDKFKLMLDKATHASKEKAKNLKDGRYGMTYSYKNMDEVIDGKGPLWKAINTYDNSLYTHSLSALDTKAYSPNRDAKTASYNLKLARVHLIKAMGLGSDATDSSIKERIKTYIRGSKEATIIINKAYILKHYDEMVAMCSDYNYIKKKVSKLFATAKKDINDEIKKLNSLKNKIDMDVYQDYMESVKFGKQTIVSICGSVMSCITEQKKVYDKILFKIILANKDKSGKNDGKMHTEAAADDNAAADTDDTSDDDSQPQEEGQQAPDVAERAAKESEQEAARIAMESVSYQSELASLFNF
jgi:hypothetical protein